MIFIQNALLFILLILTPLSCYTSVPWLEQISRQETLYSGCERNNQDKVDVDGLNHILVDHNHKLLYCYVPKVACTNWKRVFLVLTGKINTTDVVGINSSLAHNETLFTKITDLSVREANFVLSNYTSFLIVRNPFERILSAYRNKFENNLPSAQYFQRKFGRKIIKNHRKHPKHADLQSGANVSFNEFVTFLISEGVNDVNANEHWRSIDSLCQPCSINYTFVGKYETFSEDVDSVLGMVKAPKFVFPQTRSEKTSERINFYYRQLSLEYIEKLYKMYENDFKLFGYTARNVLGYDIG